MEQKDFMVYDYILAMDENNVEDLKLMAPAGSGAVIELLGNNDPMGERVISDPYCVSEQGWWISFDGKCNNMFYLFPV